MSLQTAKCEYEHAGLKPTRIKDDLKSFEKVFDWFKKIKSKDTEPKKFVSFSSGVMCSDNTVNTICSTAVGIKMQKLIDGVNFMSKVSLKFKCKNFDALKKKIKINNEDVVLEPYKLLNRLAVVSQRNVTVSESLGYELTILPTSIFNEEQFMKSSKKKIGEKTQGQGSGC